MKKKIEALFLRLKTAIRQNPVEVILSVLFCTIGCMSYENNQEALFVILSYSPVLFISSYILNRLTDKGRGRIFYFLSVLFFIPFFWKQKDIGTPFWMVSQVLIQLFYLVACWQRENDSFVRKGLGYLRSWLSAIVLSGIAWLLALSIYFSISYIFEIWQNGENRFIVYSLSIIWGGMMPLLFLMFNQEDEDGLPLPNRLFDILLNYVMVPALLIYAGILYVYFIKITILWSLPKGLVAYIVIGFVTALFVLKGCQPFLTRRYFDWFFRYASWIAIPALAMYWVGACYRINQYGFTVDRVYLIVVGAILTGTVLLFLTPRSGRYLYATLLSILFFGIVTYIPGISAKDIERISQTKRGNYPMKIQTYDADSYLLISNDLPLSIDGYEGLRFVRSYGNGSAMYTSEQEDSISLYDKIGNLLYKENMDSLFTRQLEKVGLTPYDSIPVAVNPDFFSIEMDSALFILEEVSIRRSAKDSAYSVSYMTPGVYLKKRVPLPAQ